MSTLCTKRPGCLFNAGHIEACEVSNRLLADQAIALLRETLSLHEFDGPHKAMTAAEYHEWKNSLLVTIRAFLDSLEETK